MQKRRLGILKEVDSLVVKRRLDFLKKEVDGQETLVSYHGL